MPELNPQWTEKVIAVVNNCPYFRLQSMKLMTIGGGLSRLEIDVEEKHLQPFGIVHGGVFSSLIDAAGFWAAYSAIEDGLGMTTVELKLNYLAPSSEGKLIGLGRTLKTGRTISLAEASIENQSGRLLAHGTVTLMSMPDLKMDQPGTVPPKFLDPGRGS